LRRFSGEYVRLRRSGVANGGERHSRKGGKLPGEFGEKIVFGEESRANEIPRVAKGSEKEKDVSCGGPRVIDTHRVSKGEERERGRLCLVALKVKHTLVLFRVCLQAVEGDRASLGRQAA
jgi:hypothetical protein